VNDKKGLFQEADGGTIFLDEIGTMPPMLQSRLLRVLQEKEVRRVGDNVPIMVNVRVLAATNEPLEKRVKEGTFREDLYYRLNVIPINLPPLRDRREDIPMLAMHFLKNKLTAQNGKPYQITKKAMDVLCSHSWPGNVRELENALERACALCQGATIRVGDLPPALHQYASKDSSDELVKSMDTQFLAKQGISTDTAVASKSQLAPPISATDTIKPLKEFLRDQEVSYLNRVLAHTGGDKEKTAELLGVSLATLYRKLTEEEGAQ
jgi:DNA-binding NtrC family response regulator